MRTGGAVRNWDRIPFRSEMGFGWRYLKEVVASLRKVRYLRRGHIKCS